jgi:hypothetical protein
MMADRARVLALTSLLAGALGLAFAHAAAAAVLRHGTIKFTATVTIKSAIPTSTAIHGTFRINGAGVRTIEVDAPLTRSGSTATMTATVPYSWELDNLSTPISKKLFIAFQVSSQGGDEHFAETQIILPMPADGATTTIAIPAAL